MPPPIRVLAPQRRPLPLAGLINDDYSIASGQFDSLRSIARIIECGRFKSIRHVPFQLLQKIASGCPLSRSQSHKSSQARIVTGNSSWPEKERITTSAFRAALAAAFPNFPNPQHIEIPHLFFECTIQRADQSFGKPPSDNHRFDSLKPPTG